MRIVRIAETGSTNSWISDNAQEIEAPCLVYATAQTAGRGQRGNSWEAEPGKNLTASVLLSPEGVEARRQFVISEAIALAVTDFLQEIGVEGKVKWPNDIYVGDRKICGILIENSILGKTITRTIAGIGVNINQREFLSDAPNPVSVWQLTGKEHDIAEMASILALKVERRMALTVMPGMLHSEFLENLWRGDGEYYPFHDKLRNEKINARICGIAEDGVFTVATDNGEERKYMFKEIEFVL